MRIRRKREGVWLLATAFVPGHDLCGVLVRTDRGRWKGKGSTTVTVPPAPEPSPPPAPDPSTQAAADISMSLWNQTDPLRQEWLRQGMAALTGDVPGGYDFRQTPLFKSMLTTFKGSAEPQYALARQNIIASTPRGGDLYSNLANLDIQRAKQASEFPAQMEAALYQDILDKIYGIVSGAPQTSVSGLNIAGATNTQRWGNVLGYQGGLQGAQMGAQAQMDAANSMAKGQALGGLGQGAGSFFAGGVEPGAFFKAK